MSDGAIDNEFTDAERPPDERLFDAAAGYTRELSTGDVAVDLVTGQPVYVIAHVSTSVVDFLETEEFDLLTYKYHPYLPITAGDPVFECVFIPTNAQDLIHPDKSTSTYDFPRGRLARVAIEDVTGGLPPHDAVAADVLARLLEYPSDDDAVADILGGLQAVFRNELVDEVRARAAVDEGGE